MRITIRFLVAGLAALLAFTQVSFATVIHVPADQPTIQAGINAAVNGDTVLVAPGTYSGIGNRDLSTLGKNVFIKGALGADSTVIDCGATFNGFSSLSNTTTVQGLTIRRASIGINCVSTSPSFENCRILDFRNWGIYVHGGAGSTGFEPRFSNCTVRQDSTVLNGTGTGIAIQGTVHAILTGCAVSHCGVGISIGGSGTDTSGTRFQITNCEIKDNASRGVSISGVYYVGPPKGSINYCNFSGGSQYDVYADRCFVPAAIIDARFNWWGSANGYAAATRVYDRLDNNSECPIVNCSQPLDAPYPGGVPQASYISGTYATDTTLLASGSPYRINGYYGTNSGKHLTIEAGAKFYFGSTTALFVEGELTAVGRNGDHIFFTTSADTIGGNPSAGGWKGVRFLPSSSGVLRNCDVRYADNCVYMSWQTSPEIDSCLIENFLYRGILVDRNNQTFSITTPIIQRSVITQSGTSLQGTGTGVSLFSPDYSPHNTTLMISNCTVSRCGVGIDISGSGTDTSGTRFQITNCDIKDNASRGISIVSLYSWPWTYYPIPHGAINYCNFSGNGQYYVYTGDCGGLPEILDARYNWWGSKDGYVAALKIYDRLDFASSPVVDCSGPLDAPSPGGVPQSDYVSGLLLRDTTLTASNSPYRVNGYFGVIAGTQLTIAGGTQFYFGPTTGILVGGTIAAVGTTNNRILFTSSADTSRGNPSAGAWKGVQFFPGAAGELRHCDLRYGDNCVYLKPNTSPLIDSCRIENFSQAGVYIDHSSTDSSTSTPIIRYCAVTQSKSGLVGTGRGLSLYHVGYHYRMHTAWVEVTGCQISKCQYGIYFYGNATETQGTHFTIKYCDIADNSSRGIWIEPSFTWPDLYPTPKGSINYCNFSTNGQYDLYAGSCADPWTVIDARHNWWQAIDSTTIADSLIWDQLDNSSSPFLRYMAFFTSMGRNAESVRIVTPDSVVSPGVTIKPSALIRNAGVYEDTIPVIYEIGTSGSLFRDSVQIILAPGDSGVVIFGDWIADSLGSHMLRCVTLLPGDVCVMNDSVEGVVSVVADTSAPIVFGITPSAGGNSGTLSALISGRNFRSGAQLCLWRTGSDTLRIDTSSTCVIGDDRINARFDLNDADLGTWNVVVRNPDSKAGVFNDGFTVQAGREMVWIEVLGRSRIRIGSPAHYVISCGNSGNIDFGPRVLILSFPDNASFSIDLGHPNDTLIPWDTYPVAFSGGGTTYIPISLYNILPGETHDIPIEITPRITRNLGQQYSAASSVRLSFEVRASLLDRAQSKTYFEDVKQEIAKDPALTPAWEHVYGPREEVLRTVDQIERKLSVSNFSLVDVGTSMFLTGLFALAFIAAGVPSAVAVAGATAVAASVSLASFCVTASGLASMIAPDQSAVTSELVWSLDPNDKVGPVGFGSERFVPIEEMIHYVVFFENVDSATASAENILITDTLDANLDASTFSFGDVFPGAGSDSIRPNFSYTTNFEPATGVISWTLNNINLPPDTMPYWGEGWVSYSVKPKSNLPSGIRIDNIAAIKFDENDWILAPMDSVPIFNTIDVGAPVSAVFALPDTLTSNEFMVRWGGQDDSAGCGIKDFDIYVSENYAPFELWITQTAATCSLYTGFWGGTYQFYSVARDNVGHREPIPDSADAITVVGSCGCNGFCDLNLDGSINAVDVVIMVSYVYKMKDQRQQIAGCPAATSPNKNGDWDCSDLVNAVDVVYMVNYVYKMSGIGPCDPCAQ